MLQDNSSTKIRDFGVEPRNEDQNINTPTPILLSHIKNASNTAQSDRDSFLYQHLIKLKDEHSSYQSVIRACAFINQSLASEFESSVTMHENGDIWTQKRVIRTASYVEESSEIISSLSHVILNHHDRRSRIIAVETLVNKSMTTLVNCITSPQFMNDDDISLILRLQDEICNDVVENLTSCALEDDDGVATVAFEAINNMTSGKDPFDRESELLQGSTLSDPATGRSDDFYKTDDRTYNQMKSRFISKYQDFDFPLYILDLKNRMMNSVLIPRARKLLCRMQQLKGLEYKFRSLPLMNRIIIFSHKKWVTQNDSSQQSKMDKLSFAQRWFEYDVDTMIHEYIHNFLILLLTASDTSEGRLTCNWEYSCLVVTNEALRLLSALDSDHLSYGLLVSVVLQNLESLLNHHLGKLNSQWKDCTDYDINTYMDVIKCAFLASRVVPLEKCLKLFRKITKLVISHFPAVIGVPLKGSIPSFYCSGSHADLPIRFRAWIEIASIFFISPSEWESSSNLISNTLSAFLKDESVVSLMSSRAELIESNCSPQVAEEMVYAFCTVAHTFSKRMLDTSSLDSTSLKDWVNCSLKILKAFGPCVGWFRENKDEKMDEPISLEGALTLHFGAQRSYLELLSCVLCVCKLIPSPSLYIYFMNSMEVKSDALTYSDLTNVQFDISVENAVTQVLDQMQYYAKVSPSRKMRLSILSILCDTWISKCRQTMDQSGSLSADKGPVDIDEDITNINEQQARSLLSLLGNEISTLITGESISVEDVNGSLHKSQSVSVLRGLLMCIACIESICYTAHLAANFFATDESYAEEEESARYIVSLCLLILKGQGKIDTDSEDVQQELSQSSLSKSVPDLRNSPEQNISKSVAISPQSPNRKARINAFSIECSDAARRIDTFIGVREDVTEQNDLIPTSIDFSCLCPLMKRPHFGLGRYDSSDVSVCNSLWALNSAIPSVSDLDHCIPSCNLLLQNEGLDSSLLSESCKLFLSCRNELSRHSSFINKLDRTVAPGIIRNVESKDPMNEFTLLPCTIISGSSDPLEISLNTTVRSCRNGQNSAYTVVITIEIHNKTPITIPNGLFVTISTKDTDTPSSFHVKDQQLHIDREIKSNDRYICEFIFFTWPMSIVEVTPRITYIGLKVEKNIMQRVIVKDTSEVSYQESTPTMESTQDLDIYCESVCTPIDLSFSVNDNIKWKQGVDVALFTILWLMSPSHDSHRYHSSLALLNELPLLCSDELQCFTLKNITSNNECILVQKKSSDKDGFSFMLKRLIC